MPPISPEQRAAKVADAARDLPAALRAAQATAANYGADHPATLTAWEIVEALGATVHRQARLLAGKSKGG